jgi:SAM-dependent methyltransferase
VGSASEPGIFPPFPPLELAHRVGSLADADDAFAHYNELGRHAHDSIVDLLPSDWSFHNKRVLDFGCGAGRTLRHFTQEALECEFWGCDIDADSIEWLKATFTPPFHVFKNAELPPLDLETQSFDFVYAISVFTHLTDSWSRWLLELHRILAPGGLLLATFIGPGAAPHITDEPWLEDRIGMNVLRPGQSWDLGGPMVLHSPWWIRAHWGRAFEILDLQLDGFGARSPEGQGAFLMRKRMVHVTPADLETPEPNEPRELTAAQVNTRALVDELTTLRCDYERLAGAWRHEEASRKGLQERVDELEASLEEIARSRSWRLTAPLRALRVGRIADR